MKLALLLAALTILDDGEKIARDVTHPLPPSAWPEKVELFALREETLAFQVVVDGPVEPLHVTFGPGLPAEVRIETFAERFVEIRRPTGNDRDDTSIGFRPGAAPSSHLGFVADALVPGAEPRAEAGQRAALWIDLFVRAPPGDYRSDMKVVAGHEVLATRPVLLHVANATLPYAATEITTFYDRATLEKRMGGIRAEPSLRRTLHAHHMSAFREITRVEDVEEETPALTGELYSNDYAGPGVGKGEGILAFGAYGALGEPDGDKPQRVSAMNGRLEAIAPNTAAFLYAVDEDCGSKVAERWLLRVPRGLRVGVTCGDDPRGQAADLVLMTPDAYDPDEADAARKRGKWVWVYNGQRPFSGTMVLDVPATDLRANGWIAARYGIPRWFYWESTFWLDNNRGGKGGADGFDPFTVAETFHNHRGDHANGDGILLYPGKQRVAGMTDDGVDDVFPSVRLKNIRRGAEDAGYIALARAIDPAASDAIVSRLVTRAVADAKKTPAWPERGLEWLEARRSLLRIIERLHVRQEDGHSRVLVMTVGMVSLVTLVALVTFVFFRLKGRSVGVRDKGPSA